MLTFATRILERQIDPPEKLDFRVDAKEAIETGDKLKLTSRFLSDPDGGSTEKQIQILSINEADIGHQFQVKAVKLPFTGRYAYIAPDAQADYDVATDAEKARYGFIGLKPGATEFADGGAFYKII